MKGTGLTRSMHHATRAIKWTQKGRARAKPCQGPTWTLHLHSVALARGQTLRREGLPGQKKWESQVLAKSQTRSQDGVASKLHSSHEQGKSMHLPQRSGGQRPALNASLPADLHAFGTHPP